MNLRVMTADGGRNVSGAQKRVAIVQSNYIPWKGYFDLIRSVDEFILYDDAQYTRRDWRNRNRIKTPQGLAWLTIPVEVKGRYRQRICDTVISSPEWAGDHWKTIRHFYANAPYFRQYRDALEELYLGCRENLLSRVNYRFLAGLCGMLNITTKLAWSMEFTMPEGKTERLVALCKEAEAGVYLSGPAARDYIQPQLFQQAGIDLAFFDYTGYPEYGQLYPPFAHDVSVIDLLLNQGPAAPQYMKNSRI